MTWLLELLSLALLAAGPVLVQASYWRLPDRVPSHFNFRGEPDAWSGRASIWLLPVVGFVLYGIVTAAAWRAPAAVLLECLFLKAEMLALFLAIERSTIRVALGHARRLDRVVWVVLVVILLTAWSMSFAARH